MGELPSELWCIIADKLPPIYCLSFARICTHMRKILREHYFIPEISQVAFDNIIYYRMIYPYAKKLHIKSWTNAFTYVHERMLIGISKLIVDDFTLYIMNEYKINLTSIESLIITSPICLYNSTQISRTMSAIKKIKYITKKIHIIEPKTLESLHIIINKKWETDVPYYDFILFMDFKTIKKLKITIEEFPRAFYTQDTSSTNISIQELHLISSKPPTEQFLYNCRKMFKSLIALYTPYS